MNNASRVLIALAVMTSTALAQPGATPPGEPPPGAPSPMPYDGSSPPPPGGMQLQAGPLAVDVDDLLARAEAASPTLLTVAKGAFRRARRAIAIGPTVGGFIASMPSPGTTEQAITFGLGLELFKVPVVPSVETLKALVMERAKAKLREQVIARFRGQQPDPLSVEQFAKEIWEEAVQEVLGLQNVRAKTMERPRLSLAFEVNKLFESDAWMTRVRAGVGVWKLTIGGSLGTAFTDPVNLYLGPEIVAHFLTSKAPRSPVVDVFLRGDFELRNRDAGNADMYTLGVRLLLDII